MGRMTTLLAFWVLLVAPRAFPQQSALQTPEDAFTSRELIAWSQLQKPQPTPQPLPPGGSPVPQPEQPQDQQAKLPVDPQSQREPVQSYTGRVTKDGNRYLLEMADGTRQLDAGDGCLQPFEKQNVKIVGNLDPQARSIEVLKVEPFS